MASRPRVGRGGTTAWGPAGAVQRSTVRGAWRTARLRELQHTLQDLAERDALTGLANRGVFNDALRDACRDQQEIAVIFIDLDGFKQINDRLGHQAGDEVLMPVAGVLRSSVRLEQGDLPCRLAGDEFVVLIRNRDAGQVARRIADRLVTLLGEIRSDDGQPIGASAGVASGTAAEPRVAIKAAERRDVRGQAGRRQRRSRGLAHHRRGRLREPRRDPVMACGHA